MGQCLFLLHDLECISNICGLDPIMQIIAWSTIARLISGYISWGQLGGLDHLVVLHSASKRLMKHHWVPLHKCSTAVDNHCQVLHCIVPCRLPEQKTILLHTTQFYIFKVPRQIFFVLSFHVFLIATMFELWTLLREKLKCCDNSEL